MPTKNITAKLSRKAEWEVQTNTPKKHFTQVHTGTTNPDDTTYVETQKDGKAEEHGYNATPSNCAKVTKIDYTFRGKITDVGAVGRVKLEAFTGNAVAVAGNPKFVDGVDLGGYGVLGNKTVSWTTLTIKKSPADTLYIKRTTDLITDDVDTVRQTGEEILITYDLGERLTFDAPILKRIGIESPGKPPEGPPIPQE